MDNPSRIMMAFAELAKGMDALALAHMKPPTAEAETIRSALEITDGKIHGPGGAGELLCINPNTLRNRMRKLGIPYKKNDTR